MEYDIYRDFLLGDQETERAFDSSEVWKNYSNRTLNRDKELEKLAYERKLKEENELLSSIEEFRNKVNASTKLKNKLKEALAAIIQNPELKTKVDPSFLDGLSLLDLEDGNDNS